jgi:hypothetical protein
MIGNRNLKLARKDTFLIESLLEGVDLIGIS